ncbi:S49 family peptidase [Aquimarina megaterium]|uniref:S49 family peptidase n=1 Tax=Aquimarina megaterium TaxID=1443666 RepID=UPI000942AF42|nr:S49 family peptidase [Aquimarina megaterium]
MLFSKTASEIRRGLWAIDPITGLYNLKLANDILSGNIKSKEQKIQSAIREVVNEDGIPLANNGQEQIPAGSIGIVSITGNMIKYGNYYCWGADELVSFARSFDNNPNIIGQIWKIDSGGGSVGAVAPYLDFLENKKKPVVALCDFCASAAKWVASGTDHTKAENNISAAFGSIGVMANFMSYLKYFKDLGIEEHTVYADQSPDKNKDFEEALKGNYKLLKELTLNPLAKKFQDTIKKNRLGKLNESIEGILTGRMFYAEDALEYGLIDSIGNFDAAIEKVKELASVQDFMNN